MLKMVVRLAPRILAAFLCTIIPGCFLLTKPETVYRKEGEVLQAAAAASGYAPDRSRYSLLYAEVASDYLSFQYQSVKYPGDRAWMIRFSQKSSEQKPIDLGTIEELLKAIGKGKEGFRVVEQGKAEAKGIPLQFARYQFLSEVRDREARKITAGGVAAAVKMGQDSTPLIYQFNVVNADGDRPDLGWTELEPLIEAIPQVK